LNTATINIEPFSASDQTQYNNEQLIAYLLHLADTSLILSQRNAEWCGHGPILEQDIAITNISLDLLGQARNFYQYAAVLVNRQFQTAGIAKHPLRDVVATEDTLAYQRTEREFSNLLITELPAGDWANTVLRQFFCSFYGLLLYEQLQHHRDEQLAAIAGKSLKEVQYHVKWSGEWVLRLGDGTAMSRTKMQEALENLWSYTGEFFIPAPYESEDTIGFELNSLKPAWQAKISAVLREATLWDTAADIADAELVFMHQGGKYGLHTEHLGFILAEMQYLQRTYPGCNW
jgi:ring-1,2-phenylacetyl-CoA epoxidase subunit PaaC